MFQELRNTRQFCAVLEQQADVALEKGFITRRERRQIDRFSTLRPRRTTELMEMVADELVAAGLLPPTAVGDVGAIDWSSIDWAAFLQQLFDMIIKFIQALMLLG